VPWHVLTVLHILRKLAEACASYCDFSKVCKKKMKKIKKKNTKKLRQTLKVRTGISLTARRIQLKFGMECVLSRRTFHRKNSALSLRHYRVADEWKWHFLGSCIIHTCLSHARIGRTTHYCVSWSSREFNKVKSHQVENSTRLKVIKYRGQKLSSGKFKKSWSREFC